MSNDKERRISIRIPIISQSILWNLEGQAPQEAALVNLSQSGVMIKSDLLPKAGDKVYVIINLPGDLGDMPVEGKVVRVNWATTKKNKREKGFAVQFTDSRPSINKILDAYCVYIRNKQIITVSKRIIEEFFGPRV